MRERWRGRNRGRKRKAGRRKGREYINLRFEEGRGGKRKMSTPVAVCITQCAPLQVSKATQAR